MNELKSYTEYNVASPTTNFTIGFDYTYGVDAVNVYVDGVLASTAGYVVTQINATTIQLDPAVTSGVVLLQRETNIDTPLHVFSAGAKFIAVNMDEDFKQVRQSQQEVRDVTERVAGQFNSLSADATAALDAANTAVTTANSIDAKATEALSKATTAEANAATALSTANTALSTANGIDAKATTALSNSTTALDTANGIDAKATQAQADAAAAQSAADAIAAKIGAANGIASLDATGKVPSTQLPDLATGATLTYGGNYSTLITSTAITVDNIPSGINRLTLVLNGVSTSGTSPVVLQLGFVGFSPETTGYLCSNSALSVTGVSSSSSTTGFQLRFGTGDTAAATRYGTVVLTRVVGNTWSCSGTLGLGNASFMCTVAGSISLAGVLDKFKLATVNGTDTFDGGSFSVYWE